MIDLRSDTVTRPSQAMRSAMMTAELGDDVYGDDPSVNRLEAFAAKLLDKEAALLVPSGTQSNLIALLTHCQRGDEYIVGGDAHTYKYEGGGAAALGGIQPQPVPFGAHGELPLDEVAHVIKADDFHFARTRLLSLENTQHGRVVPIDYFGEARALVDQRGLALHLDGARVFNASVKLGVPVTAITNHFDTVSICLSKGLGAPIGSVLCGPSHFINEARRWRKVVGGGMRQAGFLGAAGVVALTDGVARLHEDHDNAQWLSDALAGIAGVAVKDDWTQTNMVWIQLPVNTDHGKVTGFTDFAAERGVLASANGDGSCRLVTHQDVSRADMDTVVNVIGEYVTTLPSCA